MNKFGTLLLLLLILGVWACPPGNGGGGDTEAVGETSLFLTGECPRKGDSWADRGIITQFVQDTLPRQFLSGPGNTQEIPEYHDCQAFYSRPAPDQPPVYTRGIFAIYAVGDAPSIGDPAPDRSALYADAALDGLALPAAQILAEEAYEPLSILPGLNCTYLYRENDSIKAAIRFDTLTDRGCREPVPITDVKSYPYSPLDVVPEADPDLTEVAYPNVARWTHYSEHGVEEWRMGVPCDGAWCEIKPVGSPQSPANSKAEDVVYDRTRLRQRRVHEVKAWYDEQVLASLTGGDLAPSPLLGTVYPDTMLGDYELSDFNGKWAHTADVALTPLVPGNVSNPYLEKLNLAVTRGNSGRLNSVFLCHGPWKDEDNPDKQCQERVVDEPAPCESNDPGWWAKVIPARPAGGAGPRYSCVASCPYTVQIPGTARWAWNPLDEGIWMRCVNGCCQLGPPPGGY